MSEKMNAGGFCNRIVTVAERNLSLVQAAQLMRDHHVGSLVVVDETGAGRMVVGMLTDRDIITAVIAQEVDPATLRVEDVMTSDVVTALEEDSLMDVLGLMRRKGLRRLPVTSADRVLQGLITLDDLLGILSEQLRAMVLAIEAEQLRERKVRP